MPIVFRFLHILFAFTWFAALFAAHWNTLQARRSKDWAQRATLFAVNRGLSTMIALPSLLGMGIVGNLLGIQLGYKMKDTPLFMTANGLTSEVIYPEQVLYIPGTTGVTPPPIAAPAERVSFNYGAVSASRTGTIANGVPKTYVLTVLAGQWMQVYGSSHGEGLTVRAKALEAHPRLADG